MIISGDCRCLQPSFKEGEKGREDGGVYKQVLLQADEGQHQVRAAEQYLWSYGNIFKQKPSYLTLIVQETRGFLVHFPTWGVWRFPLQRTVSTKISSAQWPLSPSGEANKQQFEFFSLKTLKFPVSPSSSIFSRLVGTSFYSPTLLRPFKIFKHWHLTSGSGRSFQTLFFWIFGNNSRPILWFDSLISMPEDRL